MANLKANDIALGTWVKHKRTKTLAKVWNVDPSLGKFQLEDPYGNKDKMWRSSKDWTLTKAPKQAKPAKYKLGAKYSSTFDYDGMLAMGLKASYSWGKDKLRKLFDSFEDVNYHTASKNLWNAIQSYDDKAEAEKYLKLFHKDVKTEMLSENIKDKKMNELFFSSKTDALDSFKKDLLKHADVKKAAKFYGKKPEFIVKMLQKKIKVGKNSISLVYNDVGEGPFKGNDSASGIKFNITKKFEGNKMNEAKDKSKRMNEGAKFKKGQKVLTRDGNIETVQRINSNGNVETVENDYSWPQSSLKIVNEARELSPLQKAYSEFFFDMLAQYDVETPAKLDDATKKKFFNQVKTDWAKKKVQLAKQGIKPKSLTEEIQVIKNVFTEAKFPQLNFDKKDIGKVAHLFSNYNIYFTQVSPTAFSFQNQKDRLHAIQILDDKKFNYGVNEGTETEYEAFYNSKKVIVKSSKGIWDAKQKAFKLLKVPKSKQGLVAIQSMDSKKNQDFRFNEAKLRNVIRKEIQKIFETRKLNEGFDEGTKVWIEPIAPAQLKSYPAGKWVKKKMKVELIDYAPNDGTLDVLDVKLPNGKEESIYDFQIVKKA